MSKKPTKPKKVRRWWKAEQALALLEGRAPDWALAYAYKAVRYNEIPSEIRNNIRQRGSTIKEDFFKGYGNSHYTPRHEEYDDRNGTKKRGKFKYPKNLKEHRK